MEAGERALAAKLIATMCAACALGAVQVEVSASVGIAVFPDDGHSAQELIERPTLRCTPRSIAAPGRCSGMKSTRGRACRARCERGPKAATLPPAAPPPSCGPYTHRPPGGRGAE